MNIRTNFADKTENALSESLLQPYIGRKVAFHTLGCKLNFAESAMIMQKFRDKGYRTVDFDEEADVYIINTCSVTHVADKKCRQAIKKAAQRGARVVVMGCYAQLKPEEIAAIEGVNLVLGTSEKFRVIEHVEALFSGNTSKIHSCDIFDVESFDASYSITERTRAFLKVQDGCNYNCTYCTIPLARGISRNTSVSQIVKQAQIIASKGVKEIVLTGVNIGDFGHSTGESFFQLIQALDQVDGIERFRISSIEPNLLSDEIIDFVAESQRFVPHFHIPLQSGSNQILAAMGRRYKREVFESRIKYIRQVLPFAGIGADVIVGFPGETDELFDETYQFIQNLDLTYLHVFPFSDRPNTKAFEMKGKVNPKIKERRSKLLIELSNEKRKKFYRLNTGRKEKVIFEARIRQHHMYGFTTNYIKVEAPYDSRLIGNISLVEIGEMSDNESCKVKIL
ncbi:MAG: tRNA (N(6)-L-threonylcarbamoyladenosine(37)-C(2))-methylthiotransferase MtaB [Bacteroidales bacterium]|nr:tRNA (N(6)-L-threonylcarbamoyladenosine(37)-C(2))-methylthiotransferase MtaB [Bacteroidales bacterium]